jgi:hypothetical protein
MDRTTEGYAAEPDEVEALLHNLCGYHLAERNPVQRYEVLTREQVLYDALVAAIRRERGRALAELAGSGRKLTEIADLTKLRTRQRVQRLIALFRSAEAAMLEAFPYTPDPVPDPPAPAIGVASVPAPREPGDTGPLDEVVVPPAVPAALGWPDFFDGDEDDGSGAEDGPWWRRRRTGAA